MYFDSAKNLQTTHTHTQFIHYDVKSSITHTQHTHQNACTNIPYYRELSVRRSARRWPKLDMNIKWCKRTKKKTALRKKNIPTFDMDKRHPFQDTETWCEVITQIFAIHTDEFQVLQCYNVHAVKLTVYFLFFAFVILDLYYWTEKKNKVAEAIDLKWTEVCWSW